MQRFLLFVALGVGTAYAQEMPVTGVIVGKVVDSTTKAGIRKATVYATPASSRGEQNPNARFTPPTVYSAVTDDGGAYRFAGLPPGPVDLRAEKSGHLPAPVTRRERTIVKAGDEVAGAELALMKQGIIAGRVTDSDGEPMEQVNVMAIPARQAKLGVFASTGQGMSDDRGEFRIARLMPGKYKLIANRPSQTSAAPNLRTGEPVLVNAPTFFPSALDQTSASEIAVGSGEERTGLEIRMQQTAAVKVSGRVTGGDFGNSGPVSVALQTGSSLRSTRAFGHYMNNWHTSAGADGRFVFQNVLPGEYVAVANIHRGGGGPNWVGMTKVRVGQQDVDQLTIPIQPMARITGKVTAEGSAKLPQAQININVMSAEPGMMGGGGAMVKADGTFAVENLPRTALKVLGMAPPGWYLKALSVGGQRQPGLEFELTTGEMAIELTYSDKPGAVEVTVEGLNDAGTNYTAIVVPEEAIGQTPIGYSHRAVPVHAGQGAVKIENVPPGKYYIVAGPWELQQGFADLAIWAKVKNKAVAVKVEEGVTVSAAPRLIVESDVDEN